MNILILGGNGFIGKNMGKYLSKRGYYVTSFDISQPESIEDNIQYVKGDFFNIKDLNSIVENKDIVIHAISTINPGNSNMKYMQGYTGDFIQSIKLAELSLIYKFKLIYLSSGGTVYGNQEKMPILEDTLPLPVNHYGNLKLCVENTFRTFNIQTGSVIKIVRIANPYGPGQDYLKGVGFIDAALKKALNNEKISIFGDGSVIRDYIYIDDVCKMLEQVILYSGGIDVFNIGTGIGTSQKEIISIIENLFNIISVEYLPARTIDVPKIVLDNSRICKLYDGECIDIRNGIYKYYSYMIDLQ